ncbi:MAG: peptidase [Planctomycetia bacterium]|nr:MAG: peptidase [Planctomycetia bacterium]
MNCQFFHSRPAAGTRQPCSRRHDLAVTADRGGGRSISLPACVRTVAVALALAGTAWGARVTHKDGRVLTGKIGPVAGVAEDPNVAPSKSGAVDVKPILVVDDGLRRVFVPKAQIVAVNQAADDPTERIRIAQQVAKSGRRIGGVGSIVRVEPFDKYGRRVFTMMTTKGPIDIIQGITELTPRYTKVEALGGPRPYKAYVWEMRIATSSIPRETLSSLLNQAIDSSDAQQRLRVVRLFLQSERYTDAKEELERVLADFPGLKELQTELRTLRQLGARHLLREIQLRKRVGQHELAAALLQSFPADGVAGETLQHVREILRDDRAQHERMAQTQRQLAALAQSVSDQGVRGQVEAVLAELDHDLNLNTLDRMAAFARLADDESLSAQQKLALAVSGWLVGSSHATENLPVGLSLWAVRDRVRKYLRAGDQPERNRLLEELRSLEGATPEQVSRLIALMKPPLGPDSTDSTDSKTPGFHQLTIPGLVGHADVPYLVQVPPEYDPLRRYPAVVTLNGAGSTPQLQLDWWAGAADNRGQRQGQAMRHGYITVAIQWQEPHQHRYGYSARAHHAVLAAVREACRRFSIDTDRIFLSGHDIGGDAAWDMALAHPDLWAGALPIAAVSERYGSRYWENARYVPFYFVGGELDGDKIYRNAHNFDRYLRRKFDVTVVEYLGRGHEHFYDEIQNLFDWMGRQRRDFFPAEFHCATMRPWDNYFWWLELSEFPPRTMVDPADWPPRRGTRPLAVAGWIKNRDHVIVRAGSGRVSVWLAPELVNFQNRITVDVNNREVRLAGGVVQPDLNVLLEDVRTRGDRQHPFWARIDSR